MFRSCIDRLLVASALFAASCASAWADGKDHPLLSRVTGTEQSSREEVPFGVATANPIGKLPGGATSASYEGKVTRMTYGSVAGTPPGEIAIYRNYLNAVTKAGGRQLNSGFDASSPITHVTGDHVFALSKEPNPPIALLNITNAYNYQLTIVEPKAMEQSVTAGQLAEQLKATGVATLYINFDTAKAELKSDGQAAVKAIVALLRQDPALRLSIDGHTDNVGNPASNQQLSQARAQAVMQAVVAAGIDAKRLKAAGYGATVPIADNRTEDGRAKNRRVELVRQK